MLNAAVPAPARRKGAFLALLFLIVTSDNREVGAYSLLSRTTLKQLQTPYPQKHPYKPHLSPKHWVQKARL